MDLCHAGPIFERLDSRLLCSGTPVASVDDLGVLVIEGTEKKDVILVDVDGENARVSFGSKGRDSTVFSNIKGLTIRGNGGDDNITANVKNVLNFVPDGEKGHAVFSTRVDGDSGKDTITVKVSRQERGDLVITGGDDADRITLVSTSVESFIDGGKGNDTITCLGGYVSPESSVHYGGIILLGSDGDDRITSFVDAYLSGAEGDDRLRAVGGIHGSVFYGGSGHNYARGGSGDDSYLASGGLSDRFYGGRGNDLMTVLHSSGFEGQILFDGGAGNADSFFDDRENWSLENTELRRVEDVSGLGHISLSTHETNPPFSIARGGTENITANVVGVTAVGEAVRIEKVDLQLRTGTSFLILGGEVTLWDGNVHIGTGAFVGSLSTATIILRESVVVNKNSTKALTVKIGLSVIGVNYPGIEGAVVTVDVVGLRAVGEGSDRTLFSTGVSSGSGIKMSQFPEVVAV